MNRWIASYDGLTIDDTSLEHYGRVGMKWGQHIFGKDPAAGRKYIDKKRKALAANVSLAKDAARRGNAKKLAKLNAKTKKMAADVKQLEEMFEEATGQKYNSNVDGEAAAKETKDTAKAEILRSGSAKDVFAIKDQLTQSEMQDAINRIQKETQLAKLRDEQINSKINTAQNYVKTAISLGGTAVDAFNTYEKVAKMTNTITGEDTLPIFTGRKEKEKKDKDKKRADYVESLMKKGDAKEIYEHLHLFTNDEVTAVNKRLTNKGLIKDKVDKIEAETAQKLADEAKAKSDKLISDFKNSLAKEKEYKNIFSEWDDWTAETTKAETDIKDIVESALKDYDRSVRGKGAATKETYGLSDLVTEDVEKKASDWIDSFLIYEKKNKKKKTKSTSIMEDLFSHSDLSDDELMHYGRLGMKWYQHIFTEGKNAANKARTYARKKKKDFETKKYKDYNVDLEKVGSNVHGKTRYTNIDGSLNERGKLHSQKYINKEQNKNRKYYDKQIDKYKKLLDKYKDDPELKKKFEAMIKDAEKSRDGVNNSLDKFGIQEILTNEARARDQALRIAGVIASGAALGTAGGVTAKVAGDTMLKTGLATAEAFKNFDMKAPMDSVIHIVNSTEIGRKGEQAAETAIRTYSDAKSYVAGIYLDQMARRLEAMRVPQTIGDLGASAINSAVTGIDQNAITGLGKTTTDAITQLINNSTATAITNMGGLTVAAINNAGALNTAYGKMDYNHNNLLQSVGNLSLDDEINIMMNDPNYLRLVNQMSNGGRKTPNALNPH